MRQAETKPYLKIGDAAALAGVSSSVIRSWENLGLIRPQRTSSRYRLYSSDDVKLLKRAVFLRKVRGLNAPAIVQMLKQEGRIRPDSKSNGAAALGLHLRQLRIKEGASLAQVAGAAGISVGFLSALERSQMSASVGTLRKLAKFYKTNILEFSIQPRPTATSYNRSSEKFWRPAQASAWNCWHGAKPSWSLTCFALRLMPAAASLIRMMAKNSYTSCAASYKFPWKAKSTV
jgi:DNA-binding transcriptional MerR regulator